MRKIAEISDQHRAEAFTIYLTSLGIACETRESTGSDGATGIWIIDEDKMLNAEAEFNRFISDPENPRYKPHAVDVLLNRLSSKKKDAPKWKLGGTRYVDVRTEIWFQGASSAPVVTITLIAICAVLFVLQMQGFTNLLFDWMFFSKSLDSNFFEIRQGQLWRLVTPIFLHGNFLHIAFNMMWLYELGGQIELREKAWYLIFLLILFAVFSNVTQYLLAGPDFLGFSGVLYGFLGYIWMMTKFDVAKGYFIARHTVATMLIWLVICFFMPMVANGAHAGGFFIGVLWGVLRSRGLYNMIRRWRFRRKF